MTTHLRWPLACLAAALLGIATAPAVAQDAKAAERVQQLVDELATTDAKAFAARLQQLEHAVATAVAAAAELRKEAAAIEARATAKDAEAAQLRTQIEQLRALQELAGKLPKPMPAPAPAAKPATPPAEPAKAPEPPPAKVAPAAAAEPDEFVAFDREIAPLFDQHCVACHDADSKKGGLDVSSFAALQQGGGSGKTLVAGEPEQSRLWLLVAQRERPFMPKDADPLPAAQVALLRRWIEQGAAEDPAGARAFAAERKRATAGEDTDAPLQDAADAPMPSGPAPAAVRHPSRPAIVRSLARSPRAPLLAMPGERELLLVDPDLRPLAAVPCPFDHVELAGFSADGTAAFAAGGERGRRTTVVVHDVRTGELLARCDGGRDAPLAAAVDRARGLVAFGGSGRRAHVCGFDGVERWSAKHDDFVLSLAFSGDGALLAAADRAGNVQLWETATGRLADTLAGHQGAVNAVACRGRKLVASAGQDGTVRLWDAKAGKELWRQGVHQGAALAVCFGPDDRVASCGQDGRIAVCSREGKVLARSPGVDEWLYAVAFGTGAGDVLAGDWQGRIHRFDVAGKKLRTITALSN